MNAPRDLAQTIVRALRRSARSVRSRLRPPTRKTFVTLGLVLAVFAIGAALDAGSASPWLCVSCHEMEPHADRWSSSAHAAVRCVDCHQEPTAWYELPQRVTQRAVLLGRDVLAHTSGTTMASAETTAPADLTFSMGAEVPDEVCLQCHDPNRRATSGFRILIDHPEHAKRNGSCVSCHVRTAHPIESRGGAMSLMTQCFTCHGTPALPQASAECDACHPAGYELLPASHEGDSWKLGHATAAKSDPTQCTMCHAVSFCDDCHGVRMPHPIGWESDPTGHAATGATSPEVCVKCHGSYPDLCTTCHHESYDPSQGSWIGQHPADARSGGTEPCMSCHPAPSCSFCHTRLVELGL